MAGITETTGSVKAPAKRRAAPATSPAAIIKKSAPPAAEGGASVLAGSVGARRAPKAPVGKRIKINVRPAAETQSITYARAKGVNAFVDRVAAATPMEIVEVERRGIDSMFLKDLSRHMHIPAVRIFDIVGVPKATAEKKVAANEPIAGAGGQAALGLARLLAIARDIVENSTAPEAKGFDAARWLGQWIERPQPALGGRKPADLIGTPTGLEMVARVLGAIESGAYQ
jgi:putative toxin-antitoxin system antitoxin component (TIGR02293 family)